MEFGPLQVLVVAFEDPKFTGEILPELRRLREHDIVRLIDMVVVSKADDGSLSTVEMSDLTQEESRELGSVVGALIGFGAEDDKETEEAEGAAARPELLDEGVFTDKDRWAVADLIPVGSAAAVALLEHRWAIPMREMVHRAGGVSIADGWVHPDDLVATGAESAARSTRSETTG